MTELYDIVIGVQDQVKLFLMNTYTYNLDVE